MSNPEFSLSSHDREKEKARQARALFKALVDEWGPTTIDDAIKSAERVSEKGYRGITLPTEDHSTMLTIDNVDEEVSFEYGDWGHQVVSLDTAKVVVSEVLQERKTKAPHS